MRLRHRLNVPASELAGRRQTSVSAVEPPRRKTKPVLAGRRQMSAAKLSRPEKVRFAHPLPHHRLAKTQIICAILPRRRGRGILFFLRTDGTDGTIGTGGTRMRRNQKDFFHPLNRRAEAAPQKTNLNKVCHSVSLCPISPISPISPRNAPAAPFECPSQ